VATAFRPATTAFRPATTISRSLDAALWMLRWKSNSLSLQLVVQGLSYNLCWKIFVCRTLQLNLISVGLKIMLFYKLAWPSFILYIFVSFLNLSAFPDLQINVVGVKLWIKVHWCDQKL
jgi:hypothetical protein